MAEMDGRAGADTALGLRGLMPAGLRILAFVLALLGPGTALVAAAPAALAQEQAEEIDYARWEAVASRAEGVLEEMRASDVALEGLRAELADWRARFLAAQSVNQTRVDTLRSQLQALGPAPADGEMESPEIAARRADLEAQLARLEAPRLKAEEAYSRADGLIREIDTIIRERQARRLLTLGPSPLDPALWPKAWDIFTAFPVDVGKEIAAAWASDAQKRQMRDRLPEIIFYLVVALVLLLRGHRWMERLTGRYRRGTSAVARGFYGFLISLGQVALPVVGIYAFVQALFASGLLGFRGEIVAEALPVLGLGYFGARWLALRLFPADPDMPTPFRLPPGQGREARAHAALLGLLWGLERLLDNIISFERLSEEMDAALNFPLLLAGGVLLLRLGRLLHRCEPEEAAVEGATHEHDLRSRMVRAVGRILTALGIIAPLAGAVGYLSLATVVVYPTILTLGLLGLLVVIGGVLRDGYALVARISEEEARNALVPVLVNFTLFLASTPLFALIWGARVSDLTELWTRFLEGITIGDTRISPSDFLTFVAVFAVGYVLTRMVQATLRNSILPRTRIDPGGQNAIESGVGYLGIFLAAVIAITTAGIDLSSLAIVAGALSVGIGFGLQNIVSNFVSGIILLIERPISEGDWIEVGGQQGYVRDISVRSTRIETFDRTDVIVPNADLISGPVTNYTRGNLVGRAVIGVGVAYGTDTRKVEKILREIAQAHPMVSTDPPPGVHLVRFGADALEFEIRAILRDVNYVLSVRSDINHEIVRRFAEEGIEIPFAQRDIWLRNPEALRAVAEKPTEGDRNA